MKQHLFIVGLVLVMFSSCITTNYVSLEVRNPARITFTPDVNNILIVDNSLTVSNDKVTQGESNKTQMFLTTDSAKNKMLYSLKQFMSEEKYFGNVNIYPYNTYSGQNEEMRPLTKNKLQLLASENGADAIITLDFFAISAALESENIAYFSHYSFLSSKIGVVAQVYNNNGQALSKPITHVDSLFLEGNMSTNSIRNNVSEINGLIEEISIITADKLTSFFIPSWKKENRFFYSDNSKKMKEATLLTKNNKWEEAAAIWEELYKEETKWKKKTRLALNLALANEYMDNIEEAYKWIEAGYNQLPEKDSSDLAAEVVFYRKRLTERLENKPKLYQQLGLENISEE